jgi:hypothetical protein
LCWQTKWAVWGSCFAFGGWGTSGGSSTWAVKKREEK